jgi:predicted O-linked N-acetylglucosamine transferase (SPINDLY family)
LKSSQLESDYLKNQIVKFFMSRGIEPNRLRLEGKKNQADHFETYNQVDIALDPFPYQGVTTTIEALWMGVPVLTKKGNSFISNHGEMISHFSGQADWVATDEEDYLMKAIQFSSDISNLTQIRSVLRQKILGSILVDSERFALQFQDILQKIWNNHINAQNRSTL